KKQPPNNDQSDTAPKFPILDAAQLLLQSIDWSLQHDSLRTQHPFLGRVIRLKRHVEIESCGCKSEQSRVRRFGYGDQRSENQDVNRRLDKLAVIDGTDARNQTESESADW